MCCTTLSFIQWEVFLTDVFVHLKYGQVNQNGERYTVNYETLEERHRITRDVSKFPL